MNIGERIGSKRGRGRGGNFRPTGPGGPRGHGPGGPRGPGPGGPRAIGPGGLRNPGPGGMRNPGPGGPRNVRPGGPRNPGAGGPRNAGPRGPSPGGQRFPSPGGPRGPGPGGPRGMGPRGPRGMGPRPRGMNPRGPAPDGSMGPRPGGPMMGMRPQGMRMEQPFRQNFEPNFEGSQGNFNSNAGPPNQRGQPRGRGGNKGIKRPANGSTDEGAKKKKAVEVCDTISMDIIPKDALSCLETIESNVGSNITIKSSDDSTNCKLSTLTFKSKEIEGFGASDEHAKDNVAESALRSLVENPDPDNTFGVDTVNGQDLNIWKSIVSFSLYKLIKDWKNGRIGLQPRDNWLNTNGMAEPPLIEGCDPQLYLPSSEFIESARKRLPKNPETFHPSVLLNCLCPGFPLDKEELPDGKIKLSGVIDGKEYIGIDINAKLARARLAYKFVKEAFDIDGKCPAHLKTDK